jgi:hypothetical protein
VIEAEDGRKAASKNFETARGSFRFGRVEERRGGLGPCEPSLRFLSPLVERNVRISRITLSDWLHVRPTAYMIGASARDG